MSERFQRNSVSCSPTRGDLGDTRTPQGADSRTPQGGDSQGGVQESITCGGVTLRDTTEQTSSPDYSYSLSSESYSTDDSDCADWGYPK